MNLSSYFSPHLVLGYICGPPHSDSQCPLQDHFLLHTPRDEIGDMSAFD